LNWDFFKSPRIAIKIISGGTCAQQGESLASWYGFSIRDKDIEDVYLNDIREKISQLPRHKHHSDGLFGRKVRISKEHLKRYKSV